MWISSRYIVQLGRKTVAAIGNGRNDRLMLQAAALGIAVIGPECAAAEALAAADIVAPNPRCARPPRTRCGWWQRCGRRTGNRSQESGDQKISFVIRHSSFTRRTHATNHRRRRRHRGGVMGASAAYHLAARGIKNVVLLEKGTLPGDGGHRQMRGRHPLPVQYRDQCAAVAAEPAHAGTLRGGAWAGNRPAPARRSFSYWITTTIWRCSARTWRCKTGWASLPASLRRPRPRRESRC